MRLCKPNPNFKVYYNDTPILLELLEIHSLQKGEGYKLMKQVIAIGKCLNIPITLWAETNENMLYFTRYSFTNLSKVENEYLMSYESIS